MNISLNAKLKVLIIDDDAYTVNQIKEYLRELGFRQIKTETNHVLAIEQIQTWQPDLVLLDIQINMKNTGIDIGKMLTEVFQIPFMFISSDFPVDLVKSVIAAKPSAYSMKPLDKMQFMVGLNILLHQLYTNEKTILCENKNGGKLVWEKDIIYFQASGNYWEVVTPKGKTLMRKTFAEIMADLQENQYIRIHRSYIVKLTAVKKFSSSKVSLENGLTLPISRSFQQELRNIG